MARLPGLTRFEDRPALRGANRGRTQVRNPIGDVSLQPQARPVDTYARPAQPHVGESGLSQLAGALSQISPSIQSFVQTRQEKGRKEAEDRAMRRIGGMSFQEAQEAVTGGQMTEMENPWFKAAFMRQYGERLAYQRVNELTTEYETSFDKNSGSFDDFVRQRMAGDLEQFGNDRHFTTSYTKIMDSFGAKANQAQAQYQTEQMKSDTVSGVYDTFMGMARSMEQEGSSPEEIVTAMRSRYEGNRQLLHVDFREQDKEMVRLAEAFAAEGNLPMVQAILNGDRTGADGTKLGPLSANREFQADSLRILNSAERKMEQQNGEDAFDARMTFNEQARSGNLDQEALMAHHQQHPGAFTDAQVISLINQNSSYKQQQAEEAARHQQTMALKANARASEATLLQRNMDLAGQGQLPYIREGTVLTPSGDTKTVSVDEQKEAVANEIVRQNEWFASHGGTPEVAFARNVEAFTANDLVNPQWQQILSAGHIGATQFTNSGGEMPQQLHDSVDLYMRLHNANPRLLERHITDSSDRDFFEAYRIATQYGGAAPEQALQTATAMTAALSEAPSNAIQQRFDQIDAKVQQIRWGRGLTNWWGNVPANAGYVSSEIARLGRFYAQNGLGADAALDQAKARFEATHTSINGSFIYTADKDIPPNFGELATHAIEKYAEDFGDEEGGLEASDLTIRPATNGSGWVIVNKNSGFLPVENSARANITLQSLFTLEQDRQLDVRQGIIDEQAKQQQTRLDRELGAAQRWLASQEAYQVYQNLYGPDRAEARKQELETLLRSNGRMD